MGRPSRARAIVGESGDAIGYVITSQRRVSRDRNRRSPPGASPPADMVHWRNDRRCPDEDPSRELFGLHRTPEAGRRGSFDDDRRGRVADTLTWGDAKIARAVGARNRSPGHPKRRRLAPSVTFNCSVAAPWLSLVCWLLARVHHACFPALACEKPAVGGGCGPESAARPAARITFEPPARVLRRLRRHRRARTPGPVARPRE